MPPPSLVADYLDTLGQALSFDRALARRVCREAADHLHEAAAAEPGLDEAESMRCAITAFGNPHDVARQYAALSVFKQTRRVCIFLVIALAAIFATMKGRAAWYHFVQWDLADNAKWLGSIVISIDIYAFRIALAAGLLGIVYVALGQVPTAWHGAFRGQIFRRNILLGIAASALLVSVIADLVLTAFHLAREALPASAVVPLLSTAVELIIGGLLINHVLVAKRRVARVDMLLR